MDNIDEKGIQETNVHMGQNIARFRRLKGMKQDTLGKLIGIDWQQSISRLESRRTIKPEILEKVAPILGVSVEILQTMPEEGGNVIVENNTFNDSSANVINGTYINEPTDKIIAFLKDVIAEERKDKKELKDKIDELEQLIKNSTPT